MKARCRLQGWDDDGVVEQHACAAATEHAARRDWHQPSSVPVDWCDATQSAQAGKKAQCKLVCIVCAKLTIPSK
jgi:hypothetical protein